jgi:hypothetical protein
VAGKLMLAAWGKLHINTAKDNYLQVVCQFKSKLRVALHALDQPPPSSSAASAASSSPSGTLKAPQPRLAKPKPVTQPKKSKLPRVVASIVPKTAIKCPLAISISRGKAREGLNQAFLTLVHSHSPQCLMTPASAIARSTLYSRALMLPTVRDELVQFLSLVQQVSCLSCCFMRVRTNFRFGFNWLH